MTIALSLLVPAFNDKREFEPPLVAAAVVILSEIPTALSTAVSLKRWFADQYHHRLNQYQYHHIGLANRPLKSHFFYPLYNSPE